MQKCKTVSILLATLAAVACAGGQSGNEGTPRDCGATTSQTVGLDEDTPLGTARHLFDSVTSPVTADLRWYASDYSAHFDTTLTMFVNGTPSTATYYSQSICGPLNLYVDGAILHFRTADGTFDESVSGNLSLDDPVNGRPYFYGVLDLPLAGTYDSASLLRRFLLPELRLSTRFWPPSGSIELYEAPADSNRVGEIATWSSTQTAVTGGSTSRDGADAGGTGNSSGGAGGTGNRAIGATGGAGGP